MKSALLNGIVLGVSTSCLGVFLILKRLTLVGEAMSHGILPGLGIGLLLYGPTLLALNIGAIIAGIVLLGLSFVMHKKSILDEETSFTALFIISLGLGLFIFSLPGANMNLSNLLFGNILGIDASTQQWVLGASVVTLIFLSIFYYPLLVGCFDTTFFSLVFSYPKLLNFGFYIVLIINLVASYQAVGSLLAFGLMMLPAIIARLTCYRVITMLIVSSLWSITCNWIGLSYSYFYNLPSGPTIILLLGCVYLTIFSYGLVRHRFLGVG